MAERYGPEGWAILKPELYLLEKARGLGSARVGLFLLDDAESMQSRGLVPTPIHSPESVRWTLQRISAASRPDAFLLVGNDSVIPFFRYPNPAYSSYDPDPTVDTDMPYGELSGPASNSWLSGIHSEAVPVGRLPDDDPPDLEGFIELLHRFVEPRETGLHEETFAVVNKPWEDRSQNILADTMPSLHTSPSWTGNNSDWQRQSARLLFFNLHGFAGQPMWQGFGNRWVDSLRPRQVSRQAANGRIVFATNCYGAEIRGRRSARNCVALSFLREGARAFVGATGQAYGSYLGARSAGLENADLLARNLVSQLRKGERVGRALARARSSFVEETARNGLNMFDQKTALQFILLGNPLAVL